MKFSGFVTSAGLLMLLMGAGCAKQSQTRLNSDGVRKTSSDISNQSESDESLSNSSGSGDEDALSKNDKDAARKKLKDSDLGKMSLSDQCDAYGEGWDFDETAQKCYKPGDKKEAGDICKSKGEGWKLVEETGECTKSSSSAKIGVICAAKGSTWAYDKTDNVCYEMVAGSETDLEVACVDKTSGSDKESSSWDKERSMCTTYTDPTSPENYCVQQAKGTWNSDTSECTLPDGTVLGLEDLAHHAEMDNAESGWRYDPVTGKFVKVKDYKTAKDLCASRENRRYNADKNACVGIQSQVAVEELCSDKGENWTYDVVKNECIKVEESVSVQAACEEQGKACLYNPATGEWEVVEGEITTKELCDDRGAEWKFISDKKLCVPASAGDLTPVPMENGVFQGADGKKYKNVLVLGQGYAQDPSHGVSPKVHCDESSWKQGKGGDGTMSLNVSYHYHSWWGWSENDKWKTSWQNRFSDPVFNSLCGSLSTQYASAGSEDLECPEGYMVDSISAQANLLNGFRFMNYVKIKCINFDKRSQGLKAGFSNDESSLPIIRCGGFNDVITGFKLTQNTFLKNFELQCAPLDMDKIVNGLDPVSLELPLFTGDYMFNYDTVGDTYKKVSCNTPSGSKNRVLTGIKITKSRVHGMIGKDDDAEYKQEWIALSIQPVCGTLSRTSVLLSE